MFNGDLHGSGVGGVDLHDDAGDGVHGSAWTYEINNNCWPLHARFL
jgi:hypothetical protein